jgi:hypothetical protein
MWFASVVPSAIGRVTSSGQIEELRTGLPEGSRPVRIAPGPDGNLWFTDQSSHPAIGLIGAGVQPASVAPPIVTGSAQAGTQQVCQGERWSDWAFQQPSASAFSFDGYRWLLDGSPIAGANSQAYTPLASDVGHRISCVVTATYPLLSVTVSATSAAVTVTATPVAPVQSPPGGSPGQTPIAKVSAPPPRVDSSIRWSWGFTRHYATVKVLTVRGVPTGGFIELVCRGRGCPLAHSRSLTVGGVVPCRGRRCPKPSKRQGSTFGLAGPFQGRHLGVGARISVSVLKAGWVGKQYVFTVRAGREPSEHVACLAPGSNKPGVGC